MADAETSRGDAAPEVAESFDPRHFRAALGNFASGLTVITSLASDEPVGFTCQSFYSVSVEPPLVSFGVMATSASYPIMREVGHFGVSVLAHNQSSVAIRFAQRGTDKWSGLDWTVSELGNPRLPGTLLWLDCTIESDHQAGDHLIVVGRVQSMQHAPRPTRPLLFYRGNYWPRVDS